MLSELGGETVVTEADWQDGERLALRVSDLAGEGVLRGPVAVVPVKDVTAVAGEDCEAPRLHVETDLLGA
nr:hypothetical protein BaRGS_024373 [Batillaria attramentaria]